MVDPNNEQKHIPLTDKMFWCKNFKVNIDLSNSGRFFLLDIKFFYSLYVQISRIFLKNDPCKESMKIEKFLCKDNSSQNFLKFLCSLS